MIARLGGVTLSVLLHAGLIALLLAWSAADWTRPLFVDLVERAEAPGSPGGEPSAAPSARPASRDRESARCRRARVSARPEPAAPVASGVPTSAPAPSPVAPAAPPAPPALAIAPEPAGRARRPTPTTPLQSAAPPAPSGSAAASASDGGSGVTAGGRRADTRLMAIGDREAGPARPSRSPRQGRAAPGAAPAEYGPYLRQFRQRVQESLVYPLAARRQGLGGTVELHVWLEATGRVRDVQVARSSSHGILDAAAVETIRRLGPVPFPESLPRRPLLIRIPLVYELR